ncbi:hypothetical protein WISP_63415 [Willisornis vidua]|uniref:Uncharacterized protein n=1 Tax=Willisornis vidua TaxID=1566151 RepID=A0ABQ9DFG3_9PASS|nr:hypothetical protein WISP_63415 [Willisornis vidua]
MADQNEEMSKIDPEVAFVGTMGTEMSLEAYRLMEAVPVSHVIQNLAKPNVNLNYHGLGLKGVKVLVGVMASSQ